MRLRRSLSLVLALILVLSAISVNVFASAGGGGKAQSGPIQVIPLEAKFSYAEFFQDGVAIVYKQGNKKALIDTLGQLITPDYDHIKYLGEGMFYATNYTTDVGGDYLLNNKGEIVKEIQVEDIKTCSEGLIAVSKN